MTTLAPPRITKTPYTVPSPQQIIQPALDGKQETMVLNMGPHHPSTHGVLRLVVELDGETVVNVAPDIGFLHTGIEKTMESRTYQKAVVLTDRTDYLAPFLINLRHPPRATLFPYTAPFAQP